MKLRTSVSKTETGKRFIKALEKLSYRHSTWKIWVDFVDLTAISLSNTREIRDDIRIAREKKHKELFDSYDAEEQALFVEMLTCLMEEYVENTAQDFLGSLYMELDFGNDCKGQFFTPWHIAELMARMNISKDMDSELVEKGYISVCDSTCGSGVMLIAFASVYKSFTEDYADKVLFAGQDLDPVVAKMCYIQLCLIGAAGYVKIGNVFTEPITTCDIGEDVWFTPKYFTSSWIEKIYNNKGVVQDGKR